MSRTATRSRSTSESEITVSLDLDGTGRSRISTGVGFYDHMLTALSRHSLIDMEIQAAGDVHIDGHHVVEDTAIVLGQALGEALGDKRGIRRYADATVPLDEALAHCVVDVAGRPYVVCSGEPEGQAYARIGGSGVVYAGSRPSSRPWRGRCGTPWPLTRVCPVSLPPRGHSEPPGRVVRLRIGQPALCSPGPGGRRRAGGTHQEHP